MSTPPSRVPLAMTGAIIAIAVVVLVALGVNSASNAQPAVAPSASAASSASASASAAPSPTTSTIVPFAECSKATFGPALAPLNAPANVHVYSAAPKMTINVQKLYRVTITTKKGDIVLCLQPQLAPATVNNFVTLTRNHFYDGIPFHRVVAGFVIQGGDPACIGNAPPSPAAVTGSCGQGGPGYKFNDEPVHQKYIKGCVAMANSGVNTNGSQFFICTADDTATLQPLYNLFGSVESGMNVALQIAQGDVMESVTVSQQQ